MAKVIDQDSDQHSDIDRDVNPFINNTRRIAAKCGTLIEQVDSGDETEIDEQEICDSDENDQSNESIATARIKSSIPGNH